MIPQPFYEVELNTENGSAFYADAFIQQPSIADLLFGVNVTMDSVMPKDGDDAEDAERSADALGKLQAILELIQALKPVGIEQALATGRHSIIVAGTHVGDLEIKTRTILMPENFRVKPPQPAPVCTVADGSFIGGQGTEFLDRPVPGYAGDPP